MAMAARFKRDTQVSSYITANPETKCKNDVTKVVFHWWGDSYYLSRSLVEGLMNMAAVYVGGELARVYGAVAGGTGALAMVGYVVTKVIPDVARAVICNFTCLGQIW